MNGWEAHIHEGPDEWAQQSVRLTLFRRLGQGSGGEQIIGWDSSGVPVVQEVPPGTRRHPGFRIPVEALDSLREQLKPAPAAAEVTRLEEALTVERIRVDRFLDRMSRAPEAEAAS